MVKNPPAIQETPVQLLGWEDPLERFLVFPGGSVGKESPSNAEGLGLIPGLGRSPGGGHGNPLQNWPGEFHGLYSPWGRKESDTT